MIVRDSPSTQFRVVTLRTRQLTECERCHVSEQIENSILGQVHHHHYQLQIDTFKNIKQLNLIVSLVRMRRRFVSIIMTDDDDDAHNVAYKRQIMQCNIYKYIWYNYGKKGNSHLDWIEGETRRLGIIWLNQCTKEIVSKCRWANKNGKSKKERERITFLFQWSTNDRSF